MDFEWISWDFLIFPMISLAFLRFRSISWDFSIFLTFSNVFLGIIKTRLFSAFELRGHLGTTNNIGFNCIWLRFLMNFLEIKAKQLKIPLVFVSGRGFWGLHFRHIRFAHRFSKLWKYLHVLRILKLFRSAEICIRMTLCSDCIEKGQFQETLRRF